MASTAAVAMADPGAAAQAWATLHTVHFGVIALAAAAAEALWVRRYLAEAMRVTEEEARWAGIATAVIGGMTLVALWASSQLPSIADSQHGARPSWACAAILGVAAWVSAFLERGFVKRSLLGTLAVALVAGAVIVAWQWRLAHTVFDLAIAALGARVLFRMLRTLAGHERFQFIRYFE